MPDWDKFVSTMFGADWVDYCLTAGIMVIIAIVLYLGYLVYVPG